MCPITEPLSGTSRTVQSAVRAVMPDGLQPQSCTSHEASLIMLVKLVVKDPDEIPRWNCSVVFVVEGVLRSGTLVWFGEVGDAWVRLKWPRGLSTPEALLLSGFMRSDVLPAMAPAALWPAASKASTRLPMTVEEVVPGNRACASAMVASSTSLATWGSGTAPPTPLPAPPSTLALGVVASLSPLMAVTWLPGRRWHPMSNAMLITSIKTKAIKMMAHV
mmetsp:Transcript_29831/g.40177  ORF Transcript_29831/g.40177 Transcript_29831/m.40177 type:complete len:219 (+) Transcript_29831:192-848(+)